MQRPIFSLLAVGCLFAAFSPSIARADDVREQFVRSFDGAYIPMASRKPGGPGPFPAVLFIHGGVGGNGPESMRRMLDGRMQVHFLEKGYVIAAADYRRYHFGEDEIQDVLAAYAELEKAPYVDKSRMVVIGGSHGGYLAQMLISRVKPAAAVSLAGLSDIEGMFYSVADELRGFVESWPDLIEQLQTHVEKGRQGQAREVERRIPGGNAPLREGSAGYEVALEMAWRYPERIDYYRHISPKENTATVTTPVLYLVGGEDRLRFAGKAWIDDLEKRGATAEYSEHEGMPHGFYWDNSENPPQQFFDALEVTNDFVARYTR